MAIFDQETMEKANSIGGAWIKAPEFDGDGLILQIKSVEKIKSQYGAKAEESIVEREILEEGEAFRFIFEDNTSTQRKHDSTSFPLFIAMQSSEFNVGDWLHIKREGKTDKTRYTAEKVDAPEISTFSTTTKDSFEYPEDDSEDPSNIPF